MNREKIGVALSGGVDSMVSAALLKEQGYQVHGFFMQLPIAGTPEQRRRVQAVARRLDIPLTLVDMNKVFSEKVISYFVQTYMEARTPNPCVICNREIKFGILAQEMLCQGMDRMATGHYARITRSASGRPLLRRGIDPRKDQSYFLCRLSRHQLAKIIFPLGGLAKEEVYRIAGALDLNHVHGPESQDVCFLAGETIPSFFAGRGYTERPGDIVTDSGEVLGRHLGLWRYTIGQRHGLNLPDATPWYVGELDAVGNRVIVCKKEELLTSRVEIHEVSWAEEDPLLPWHGLVQIRGRHRPAPAGITEIKGRWIITFKEKQRAVTPGQFAVFYDGDTLKGSGVIVSGKERS